MQFPKHRHSFAVVEDLQAAYQVAVVYPDEAVKVLDPYAVLGRANDQPPQILGGTAPLAQLEVHEAQLVDLPGLGVAQHYVARPEISMVQNLELLRIVVEAAGVGLHKLISRGLWGKGLSIIFYQGLY